MIIHIYVYIYIIYILQHSVRLKRTFCDAASSRRASPRTLPQTTPQPTPTRALAQDVTPA